MKAEGNDATATKRGSLRRWLLATSVLVAIVVMALPSGTMSWLRHAWPLLSRTMSWLEHRGGVLDLDHVAFFALLAFAWGVLAPASRRWLAFLCLPLLAAGTELMQFVVPGRSPRLSDFRDDVVGAVIGWALAWIVMWAVSRMSRRRA